MAFSREQERFELVSPLGLPENPHAIRDMAVTELPSGKYFLTYTKKSSGSAIRLYGAISSAARRFKKIGILSGFNSFGAVVPEYQFEKQSVLYFGNRTIKIAFSPNLKKWDIFPKAVLSTRKNHFDYSTLRVARVFLADEGIALFYLTKNAQEKLCLGAALFDQDAPGKLLWRSNHPLWEQPADWQTDKTHLVGIISLRQQFIAYFQEDGGKIFSEILHYTALNAPTFLKKSPKKKPIPATTPPTLIRSAKNPILKPQPENSWEAAATFNPAAVCIDGIVHLLYRAQGHDGISVLGYASSADGVTIHERSEEPAYMPSQPFEREKGGISLPAYPYMSGGGWGGCEDPRLSRIDDTLYMTYVAFNGCHPPGVALTSIQIEDFLAKRWHWKKPRLISNPGQIQKNWVVFPEKINGKYAILHSIAPNILIDYVDSLDDPNLTVQSYHNNSSDNNRWDNIMRGVGAPPIKTDHGWLVFYHAMDRRDPNKYKVGAMLLDYQKPEKVLCRSSQPILEPLEKYENEGFKSGVVYVCGAAIKGETLLIYYGGADMFVAVASAPIEQFTKQLLSCGEITLEPIHLH